MVYHRRILTVILILIGATGNQDLSAQSIRLALHDVELIDAIVLFEEQTQTKVAFSDSFLRGIRVSCDIETDIVNDALTCLLSDSRITFRFTPPRQFVLIPPTPDQEAARIPPDATFNGFITEAESGVSLFGAHIYLPDYRIGTTTNEAGFFALPKIPTGLTNVIVSFIGYATVDTLVAVPGKLANIQLRPNTIRIDDVLVDGRPTNLTIGANPPGSLSISVRQLEVLPKALGGKDVLSSLGLLSGIQRTGEATGGLVVRGSGTDQNLYLVDGVPLYHPWHAFSLVSTFQTEIFKDIQFYRGAFPAEYGGVLSSVMNAELRDGSGSVPRAVASINTLNTRFFIESPISSKSSFMVSGRRSYIDQLIGRNHPVTDDSGRLDTLRTGYYFYDWTAKISISPTPSSGLSFTYYTGKDILDLRLPFDISLDISSWLKPADLFFEVDQGWGNDLYNLRYHFLASDRVFVSGSLYHTRYTAREATLVQPTTVSSVISAYDVSLKDYGLRVHADYQPSYRHQIRTGVQVVNHEFFSNIDALVTYGPTLSESLSETGAVSSMEYAVFVQDEWTPLPSLSLLGGLRASYFDTGKDVYVSPRLSFQLNIDPRWATLRGSASRHVQYIQRIRDRYSFLYDLVSARWIPADETVDPATSRHYSAGIESNPSPWLKITFDAFHRENHDVILPRDEFQAKNGLLGPGIETGTLLGQYTAGVERAYGLESSARIVLPMWEVLASYTGTVSESRTPALEDDSFRPSRFDVPRALTVVAHHRRKKWNYSITMDWRSGYPITVPVSRYALEDPVSGELTYYFHRPQINNGRLPPYFRLDASIGYRFTFLRASWSAEILIYNILGRRNVIDRAYDPSRDGFYWQDRRGFPRVPLFELEMTL